MTSSSVPWDHPAEVIRAFALLFPQVAPGGFFIIEEASNSYWIENNSGYRSTSSAIEYFKALGDLVNFFHIKERIFFESLSEFDLLCAQHARSVKVAALISFFPPQSLCFLLSFLFSLLME
jgi:hypothetical protein